MKLNTIFLKVMLASFALLAIPALASAQTDPPEPDLYLMSGLLNFTRGQAVSLNFTNVDRETREVRLYFLDANGNVLKRAVGRVGPGQSVSLNFTFGELARTSSMRVGIRGVAVLTQPPDPDAQPPEPDLSLLDMELWDVQSGKTSWGIPLIRGIRNANVFPTDQ